MRDITRQRDELVIKSNELVQKAKFNLTVNEQKLIALVISMIKPTDTEFQRYEISVDDYCKIFNISRDGFYSDFTKMIDDLDNKSFWVNREDKGYIFKFRWFSEVKYKYKKSIIEVLLNSDLKEFIIDQKQNFTKYELCNLIGLKSKYSVRLFELFKSYSYQHIREFNIDELKELLCAEKYTNFKDFRNRVLNISIDEINKYTELNVSYETKTKGKKVESVVIYIKLKDSMSRFAAYIQSMDIGNKELSKRKIAKGQVSVYDIDKLKQFD